MSANSQKQREWERVWAIVCHSQITRIDILQLLSLCVFEWMFDSDNRETSCCPVFENLEFFTHTITGTTCRQPPIITLADNKWYQESERVTLTRHGQKSITAHRRRRLTIDSSQIWTHCVSLSHCDFTPSSPIEIICSANCAKLVLIVTITFGFSWLLCNYAGILSLTSSSSEFNNFFLTTVISLSIILISN